MHWMVYAGFAIVLWGVNGLFMKLGTNRVSARSMVIWVTAGFVVLLPFMWRATTLTGLSARVIIVGLVAGTVNGLGNWAVFACLENGAKASVAIPLTALYPLCTVALATVFLKERPTALQWLGIALAVAGGAMLAYEPAPAPTPSREEQLRCVQ
jgi:drug/metabolite transporter (DMT)-like permease